MTKKKIWINVLIDVAFAILFFFIYQITILKKINIFGEENTGGGWFPFGFEVDLIFFNWAIVSIIIAFVLWKIKKLGINLLPLLLIAVILPRLVYSVNHSIFIDGSGAEYKEKQTIVMHLEAREKKGHSGDHLKTLKKYPIYVSEQKNEDFYTYLYINESLDDMYLFMKLSPDSSVTGCEQLICHQFMQPIEEFMAENKELDRSKCKVISINNYGIREIEIYNNCAVLTSDHSPKTYFICNDFKWLLYD